MSQKFAAEFGKKKYTREDVRKFVQKSFPYGEDGRPIYVTEQAHLKECDVNEIIKKYDATGLITHVNNFEALYADVSSIDFDRSLTLQKEIGAKFAELPSNIRKRFDNSPSEYLRFLENPANLQESIDLGLRPNTILHSKIAQDQSGGKKNLPEGDSPPEKK